MGNNAIMQALMPLLLGCSVYLATMKIKIGYSIINKGGMGMS